MRPAGRYALTGIQRLSIFKLHGALRYVNKKSSGVVPLDLFQVVALPRLRDVNPVP